jgi:hypothetical protein
MIALEWDATCNIWTHGSKVMMFLRFQPKLGHVVMRVDLDWTIIVYPFKFKHSWLFEAKNSTKKE